MDDTKAKYLRITDMKNSENDWASITEVDINGDTLIPRHLLTHLEYKKSIQQKQDGERVVHGHD